MIIGVFIATVALAAALAVALPGSKRPTAAGANADPVPSATFDLFGGSPATLADYRGKPLVLNFWAAWCPACVAEMPSFQKVHENLGGEVIFLGLDVRDTRSAADALIERTGVTYLLGEDPDGAILASFDGIAMPTTIFIDAEGNVVGRHSGTIFEEDLRRLISEIFGI